MSHIRTKVFKAIAVGLVFSTLLYVGSVIPGCQSKVVITAPAPRAVGAGRVQIHGTKEFMGQFAPRLASLLQGDWVEIDESTRIRVPDQVGVEITATAGKSSLKFDQPLALQVTRGWGPFHANFSGSIDAVIEIDGEGAMMQINGLPDQLLIWEP